MTPPLPPPEDDELPPPPTDISEDTKKFQSLKVTKSGPIATLRRAFTIFEKDIKTMAKHGLVSAVILVIFLGLVFFIMSYAMEQAMKIDINNMDGRDGGPDIGTGVNPPTANAGPDRFVNPGQTVTLSASGSTDNGQIVYCAWNYEDQRRSVELYGETVTCSFSSAGTYEIHLTVVDDEFNPGEDSVNITVNHVGSDYSPPQIIIGPDTSVPLGTQVTLDGSRCTDDTGIVNWTWTFKDIVDRAYFVESPTYTFQNAGMYSIPVSLTITDAAGNFNTAGFGIKVNGTNPSDSQPPSAMIADIGFVTVGSQVTLDGSQSFDNTGIVSFSWAVIHNNTVTWLAGQTVNFRPTEFGPYDITLAVKDAAGNIGTSHTQLIALPSDVDIQRISWTSTPFGIDISFNLLTYAYGIALLSSVIFVGGLFAKGFAHEIQKGTLKILFFGPISVTTMVFSKILYPIVVGPFFIFPLTYIVLSPFHQDFGDILLITLASYLLSVLTMVAAAYGSCLIYVVSKRMVLKPTVISRMFLYFSLLGTLTVFEWLSFLFDNWFKTESYGNMYDSMAAPIAMFSPFHQGGVFLSNAILGTSQSPDWLLFAIPIALIVAGVFASRKLYPDLFSRE